MSVTLAMSLDSLATYPCHLGKTLEEMNQVFGDEVKVADGESK